VSVASRRASALMLAAIFVSVPLSSRPQNERTANVRRVAYAARIKAQLADFTRRVASRDIVEARALGYAALASLAVEDGSLAAGCLRRVLAAQVTDPRSPQKGSIPWNVGPSKAEDFNATEFAVQSWGPILLLYGDRLPPTVRAELIAHARAAVTAVERHVVDLSYDNIALLRAMNLVLLGTAVGDMAARTQGLQALQRFLDWRDQYGIHEFASPTYYGVDLDVLMVSYIALPRDGEVRGLLARALDTIGATSRRSGTTAPGGLPVHTAAITIFYKATAASTTTCIWKDGAPSRLELAPATSSPTLELGAEDMRRISLTTIIWFRGAEQSSHVTASTRHRRATHGSSLGSRWEPRHSITIITTNSSTSLSTIPLASQR